MNKTVAHPRLSSISLAAMLLAGILFAGCLPASAPVSSPATLQPAPTLAAVLTQPAPPAGLSDSDLAALRSLKKADDYPLYTMQYAGPTNRRTSSVTPGPVVRAGSPAWGCSLFAALGDPAHRLYGRNFDWEYSPALLLIAHPPGGLASVSMVDIAYLGFPGDKARKVTDLPLAEQQPLLGAPLLPFDGMNERGLVIGMAAVDPGNVKPDPAKQTIGSLGVIREVLDHAGSVDEAVAILGRYNIDMEGGPPLHYLVADRSGRAALVEFYRGEMKVIPNKEPWHLATNFIVSGAGANPKGQCWRYDRIDARLSGTQGSSTPGDAVQLLRSVSQDSTQWSIVYEISTGDVRMSMGKKYDQVRTFHLDLSKQ